MKIKKGVLSPRGFNFKYGEWIKFNINGHILYATIKSDYVNISRAFNNRVFYELGMTHDQLREYVALSYGVDKEDLTGQWPYFTHISQLNKLFEDLAEDFGVTIERA